jgi:hypothetical protein
VRASVIDGGTLELHGSRIRLWGSYYCGARVTSELDAFIARRAVSWPPLSFVCCGRWS